MTRTARAGDGSGNTQAVATAGSPVAFFRLGASPASTDTAPTDVAFTAVMVGKTFLGYTMVSATHFA